jgi:lysine 6-dehydrogenase
MQGKATLHDLANSPDVEHVIAADADVDGLNRFVNRLHTGKIETIRLEASNHTLLSKLLSRVEAVVVLLPNRFNLPIARLAVEHAVHVVNSSYTTPGMEDLDRLAGALGVAILPEFGFDPGIDLVLAGQAVRDLDEVHLFNSYGTGFPEPAIANHNPLHYKISWSFDGVLKAYLRDARVVRDGEVIVIPGREIFARQNVHTVELEDWGLMEAYPNGDVVRFLDQLSISSTTKEAGRYAMRYPGHSVFWYVLAQMGFLDDEALQVAEVQVSPRDFIRSLLEPQLQYADDERDVAVLRIDVEGLKDGLPQRISYQVSDVRDLNTGLMAMNRTVGYTASIGTQMILRGDISRRGLLSPLTDIPVPKFIAELRTRGIRVERRVEI